MKKLVLIFLMMTQFGLSQVGINTTSPDAQLDIKSSNQVAPSNKDGILIPKIDAFPAINPTAAQNSMMVYLTTLSAGKPPGFYYWESATTSWKGFGGTSGWATTGNSGINAATNFVGTTDDNDVVFKRFNFKAGLLGGYVTGFGTFSLNANTTGTGNTAFGSYSLYRNTTGNYNVALGSDAMSRMVQGSNGTSIGYASMFYFGGPNGPFTNTNTAIGYYSMIGEHSGSLPGTNNIGLRNTAIGYQVLQGISSGNDNTALGFMALQGNGKANENVAVGSNTLFNNTNANKNIAIGNNSLFTQNFNNSGVAFDTHNIAIGVEALYLNNPIDLFSGTDNIAIGNYAMRGNTLGGYNSVLGGYSLFSNISGGANVANGYESLYSNTYGSVNVANGYRSLYSNTNGNGNTVIGAYAMDSNTIGQDNVAIGYASLSANVSGNGNVGLGRGALGNVLGSSNVAIGVQAGFNETGSNKLYIENSASANPLIYGEFDNDILKVNGVLKVNKTGADTNEMQINNSNTYLHGNGSQNFGSGLGDFIISSRESGNETGGVYGDGNAVTIWSAGDANQGQAAALVYFLDEDFYDITNTNPYDNAALKSYISPSGAYVQISDKNKKENIVKIENASEKIDNISGYTYQFKLAPEEVKKGDKPIKSSGVLAQELEKVLPEAVQKNEKGEYFVDYAAITPLLIEAIKAQNEKIKALENSQNEILKRLDVLEKK